jgi:hypothetical protein
MSQFRVCDGCGADITGGGWLPIQSFSLHINMDLCPKCADGLVAWIKGDSE